MVDPTPVQPETKPQNGNASAARPEWLPVTPSARDNLNDLQTKALLVIQALVDAQKSMHAGAHSPKLDGELAAAQSRLTAVQNAMTNGSGAVDSNVAVAINTTYAAAVANHGAEQSAEGSSMHVSVEIQEALDVQLNSTRRLAILAEHITHANFLTYTHALVREYAVMARPLQGEFNQVALNLYTDPAFAAIVRAQRHTSPALLKEAATRQNDAYDMLCRMNGIGYPRDPRFDDYIPALTQIRRLGLYDSDKEIALIRKIYEAGTHGGKGYSGAQAMHDADERMLEHIAEGNDTRAGVLKAMGAKTNWLGNKMLDLLQHDPALLKADGTIDIVKVYKANQAVSYADFMEANNAFRNGKWKQLGATHSGIPYQRILALHMMVANDSLPIEMKETLELCQKIERERQHHVALSEKETVQAAALDVVFNKHQAKHPGELVSRERIDALLTLIHMPRWTDTSTRIVLAQVIERYDASGSPNREDLFHMALGQLKAKDAPEGMVTFWSPTVAREDWQLNRMVSTVNAHKAQFQPLLEEIHATSFDFNSLKYLLRHHHENLTVINADTLGAALARIAKEEPAHLAQGCAAVHQQNPAPHAPCAPAHTPPGAKPVQHGPAKPAAGQAMV